MQQKEKSKKIKKEKKGCEVKFTAEQTRYLSHAAE